MKAEALFVLLTSCLAVFDESHGANTNCGNHSLFGSLCLHRACCRNLERIVTRYCDPSQQWLGPAGQQGQQGQQQGSSVMSYNSHSTQTAWQQSTNQAQGGGVQSYNTVRQGQTNTLQQGQDNSREIRCRSENEFRQKNLLTDEKVDPEKVVMFLAPKVTLNDPNWSMQLLRNVTTRCAVRAEIIVAEAGFTSCKSGAYELKRCMELDLFEYCPAPNWIDAPRCREARDYVRSCPIKPQITNWQEENRMHQHTGWVGV